MSRMGTRRLLALLLLALSSTPVEAGAQQVAYAMTAVPELDSATSAMIVREVGRARQRGLPVEPLLAKAREGQIKRAAPARIRSAVAAIRMRLDSARSALGHAATPSEVVAGADALSAGADVRALRALRAAAADRDLAAPLGVLAQLVASGVPVRRAAEHVAELLRLNANAEQVLAFGVAVELDVGAGLPPEESATFRLRALESLGFGSGSVLTTIPRPGNVDVPPRGATQPRRKP